jgi:GntR family transcriptional regulator, transcriptional repressor for pyruvate dehydrogenase complex
MREKAKSPIDGAAATLRKIALGLDECALIGSEDELLERLKVSRVTVRQAARLLEREGVLRVRRGINGGYFAARPSVEMVETIVCAYLDTLGLDTRHTGGVATALWIETLRQAAGADRAATRALVEKLRAQFDQLPADASMVDLARLELESRSEIFRLIEGEYIEVFFRINSAFSRQQVEAQLGDMKGVRLHHPVFLERWRKAKLMELEAIAEGDEMLAMMTGLHTRKVWISRSSEDGQG